MVACVCVCVISSFYDSNGNIIENILSALIVTELTVLSPNNYLENTVFKVLKMFFISDLLSLILT